MTIPLNRLCPDCRMVVAAYLKQKKALRDKGYRKLKADCKIAIAMSLEGGSVETIAAEIKRPMATVEKMLRPAGLFGGRAGTVTFDVNTFEKMCWMGLSTKQIAHDLNISPQTVSGWRKRLSLTKRELEARRRQRGKKRGQKRG